MLFFWVRIELQFVKARKVISLEFPLFATLGEVKSSCRNTIGYGTYMSNVLQWKLCKQFLYRLSSGRENKSKRRFLSAHELAGLFSAVALVNIFIIGLEMSFQNSKRRWEGEVKSFKKSGSVANLDCDTNHALLWLMDNNFPLIFVIT